MRFPVCLRWLLAAVLALLLYPAAAQSGPTGSGPVAAAGPELPINLSALAALDCNPEQLLRRLAHDLRLQPYQALVLRRALLALPAPTADAAELPAAETLRLALSAPQAAQLQQLLATPPDVLLNWLALSR